MQGAEDEDELPDLIDESEEEERELQERVKDLEWKWDELQRSRKELGITRMSGRSKTADADRRLQVELARAKLMISHGRAFKY